LGALIFRRDGDNLLGRIQTFLNAPIGFAMPAARAARLEQPSFSR